MCCVLVCMASSYRFPFVACELLTCEVDIVLETLVEDEEVSVVLILFMPVLWQLIIDVISLTNPKILSPCTELDNCRLNCSFCLFFCYFVILTVVAFAVFLLATQLLA